jgi:hypothetical protein
MTISIVSHRTIPPVTPFKNPDPHMPADDVPRNAGLSRRLGMWLHDHEGIATNRRERESLRPDRGAQDADVNPPVSQRLDLLGRRHLLQHELDLWKAHPKRHQQLREDPGDDRAYKPPP